MKTTAICLAVIMVGAAPALAQQALPGSALKPGERACYGWSRNAASLTEGDATRILFELHKEVLEGQDPVIWSRLYAEVTGSAKPGYTWDGCGPSEVPGMLHCSYACDGGSLTLAGVGGSLEMRLGADGVRVRTCGSSSEELGAFTIGPKQVGGPVTLSSVDGGLCRGAMERFEQMLAQEELGID